MKRLLLALFALLFAIGGAQAHPMIWKVEGHGSTVYLLGSVHILAPDTAWRDDRIAKVIAKADTFYFETAIDQQAVMLFMAQHGVLPNGQSLRDRLPLKSQLEYDDALKTLGLSPASVNSMRPWLASLVMLTLQMKQAGLAAEAGVDRAIIAEAGGRGKPVRYLETVEQQLGFLAPEDEALELQQFEAFLDDFKTQTGDIAPMTDAWVSGDQDGLAQLLLKDFNRTPEMRKTLLDDRNKAWAKTLEAVLDKEHGTFLVTVGAGHLVTERGVPALLRRDGYRVTAY